MGAFGNTWGKWGNSYVWDSDAVIFINTTGITDNIQKKAINQLCKDLKDNFLWTEYKAIYPFIGGTATTHSYNLKSPISFRIDWTGASIHNAYGVEFTGSDYGNTNFNPSTQLTINNTSVTFLYTKKVRSTTFHGCWSGSNIFAFIVLDVTKDPYSYQYNSATALTSAEDIDNLMGIVTMTKTASNYHAMYFNGKLLNSSTTITGGSIPNLNFYIGRVNYSTPYYDTKRYSLIAIGNGLSATQVLTANLIFQNYQKNLNRKIINLNLVFDGDSITAGSQNTAGFSYPEQVNTLINNRGYLDGFLYNTTLLNYGVSAQKLSQMIDDGVSQIDVQIDTYTDCNFLCILGGINDFAQELDTTKETIYERLKTYCIDRKNAGYTVIALTLLPASGVRVDYEAERQWFNIQVKTDLINYVDGIADIGGDIRIGDYEDNLNETYYKVDHLHPNDTGAGVIAEIVNQKIIEIIS